MRETANMSQVMNKPDEYSIFLSLAINQTARGFRLNGTIQTKNRKFTKRTATVTKQLIFSGWKQYATFFRFELKMLQFSTFDSTKNVNER